MPRKWDFTRKLHFPVAHCLSHFFLLPFGISKPQGVLGVAAEYFVLMEAQI